MTEQASYFIKSAERTLQVLLAFNGSESPMTVSEVASATDLTRATARRFLLTLSNLGYLEQLGNAFQPTPRLLDIGSTYLSGLTLARVAEPHLAQLADELDETAALCVLDGQDVFYVARVLPPRLFNMKLGLGHRLPAWVTSMGRVLIASLPPNAREQFLLELKLSMFTDHTIPTKEKLRNELDIVASQGWALVAQELDEGLRGLAVPVNRGASVLGALNISVQPGRSGLEVVTDELVPQLRRTAAAIAEDYGGRVATDL